MERPRWLEIPLLMDSCSTRMHIRFVNTHLTVIKVRETPTRNANKFLWTRKGQDAKINRGKNSIKPMQLACYAAGSKHPELDAVRQIPAATVRPPPKLFDLLSEIRNI